MIILFWLETSPLDQQAAICPMSLVNLCFFGEDFLDEVKPLIIGTSDPDAFCLIHGWPKHSLFPFS